MHGDEPTDERADRESHCGYSRPDPEGCATLFRRERGRDDRERGRQHQCRPDSLQRASANQQLGRACETAEQRGGREDREADEKHEPPAVHIGELPAREHENREAERVPGHDPLELRDADPEIALNRRERDVHDGVVEHDHEQGE